MATADAAVYAWMVAQEDAGEPWVSLDDVRAIFVDADDALRRLIRDGEAFAFDAGGVALCTHTPPDLPPSDPSAWGPPIVVFEGTLNVYGERRSVHIRVRRGSTAHVAALQMDWLTEVRHGDD